MNQNSHHDDLARWGDVEIAPGEQRVVNIIVSESYSSGNIQIPVYVWRGKEKGPAVMVSAAVHGDEINGTGAIRQLIVDKPFEVRSGTLVLVPVVNMLGFERHSRYLPDRRDLNRCFPGSKQGSLASRYARSFFDQVVRRCNFGIDLHTAALRRTNFPNARANLNDPALAAFARAFGTELIVNNEGPKGSLRQSASAAGCLTMILEAGEVWKVERSYVEYTTRGIKNCLTHLGMVEGTPDHPLYRVETDTTKWIRAKHGGFLRFHVAPGTIVAKGDPIATNTKLTGEEQNIIVAPHDGIVLGMTTLPSVAPGDSVCHLAFPKKGQLRKAERAVGSQHPEHLHQRAHNDLASSVLISNSGKPEVPESGSGTQQETPSNKS